MWCRWLCARWTENPEALFNSRCAHEYGDVGKQVDPSRLERDVERRAGSSPVIPTINNYRPRSS